jgi:transposase-like protein
VTIVGLSVGIPWHAIGVVVRVHCPRCGASYETTLPAAGVRRVARCAVCNRTGLEVVEEMAETRSCTADDGVARD